MYFVLLIPVHHHGAFKILFLIRKQWQYTIISFTFIFKNTNCLWLKSKGLSTRYGFLHENFASRYLTGFLHPFRVSWDLVWLIALTGLQPRSWKSANILCAYTHQMCHGFKSSDDSLHKAYGIDSMLLRIISWLQRAYKLILAQKIHSRSMVMPRQQLISEVRLLKVLWKYLFHRKHWRSQFH